MNEKQRVREFKVERTNDPLWQFEFLLNGFIAMKQYPKLLTEEEKDKNIRVTFEFDKSLKEMSYTLTPTTAKFEVGIHEDSVFMKYLLQDFAESCIKTAPFGRVFNDNDNDNMMELVKMTILDTIIEQEDNQFHRTFTTSWIRTILNQLKDIDIKVLKRDFTSQLKIIKEWYYNDLDRDQKELFDNILEEE